MTARPEMTANKKIFATSGLMTVNEIYTSISSLTTTSVPQGTHYGTSCRWEFSTNSAVQPTFTSCWQQFFSQFQQYLR
jgi:hypothetical protein